MSPLPRIAFLMLLLSTPAAADDNTADKLGDVRSEIKSISADLSKKKADQKALYTQLEAQSRKVSELNRTLRGTAQQIEQKQRELAQLRAQMGIKEEEQRAQLDALGSQIRAAFIHAQPGYLEILLNQHDVATLSRSSSYYRYFHEAREQQLAEISATLSSLSESQRELLLAQKSLEDMLERQQQQQQSLEAENDRRRQTLASLDAAISNQDARLAALKDQEANLQKLLDRLATQPPPAPPAAKLPAPVKPVGPFSRLSGKLPWPVSGKLLARYGSPRNLGKLKWQGIVIDSPTGNDVRASATGRVVFADWLRGFGLLVIIDHGEQYMTLYGNNETLLTDVGEAVEAGQVIAQSGSQGIRGQTGLYFEIRHRGAPTNPMNWLAKQG